MTVTRGQAAACVFKGMTLIVGGAWDQRFSDGYQGSNYKYNDSSLRCVR